MIRRLSQWLVISTMGALVLMANGCRKDQRVTSHGVTDAPEQQLSPQQEEGLTRAALTQAFQGETRDEAWAKPKEIDLEGVTTRAHLPEGSTVSARCRSTICLVHVDLPGANVGRVIDRIRFDRAFATGGFVTTEPKDPARVVIFVGREGTRLNQHRGFLRAMAANRRHARR